VVIGLVLAASGAWSQTLTISHVAGSPGGFGSEDGLGAAARFNKPAGLARDGAGNLYVADTENHVIRKVAVDGAVTTLAGVVGEKGSADGIGSAARFSRPRGLAVDGSGRVFVADTGNHVVRQIDPDGRVTTLAGLAGSSGAVDGSGSAARLNEPSGVAVAPGGLVLIADAKNHAIRSVTLQGQVVTLAGLLGRTGSADGTGTAARFNYPTGITVDPAGVAWIADNRNCTIRKVTTDLSVTTFAGSPGAPGSTDGAGSAARFFFPTALSVSSTGLWVADTNGSTLRRISLAGEVKTVAGQPGVAGNQDGTASEARFWYPAGVVADPGEAAIWVADTWNHTIRRVLSDGQTVTFAGSPGGSGRADGVGAAARFDNPHGVCWDTVGIWVTDSFSNTVRRVSATGTVTTVAGQPGTRGFSDGTGSAAVFATPLGIASVAAGEVVVADSENHVIRRVKADGTVTTVAGRPGIRGSADGAAVEATFNYPSGVAVGSDGSIWVADSSNHAIRRVAPNGLVSTAAGAALVSGDADGPASAARFRSPGGLAFDGNGNLLIADTGNHTLRRLSAAGEVTTVAGLPGHPGDTDGVGNSARFNAPAGVVVDAGGRVWVADTGNHTVRVVATDGRVSTAAGLGDTPGSTDATGRVARFNGPTGVAVTPDGVVWIVDRNNHAIRRGDAAIADVAVVDSPTGSAGVLRQLDTSPQTATAWQWSIIRRPATSVATLSATTVRNPTFTPDRSEMFVFRLEASNANGRNVSTVSISSGATALLSGGASICAGGSSTLQVVLTGTPPWRVAWSDGFVQDGIGESPVTRTVSPGQSTTYTLTAVSDATGSGSVGGSATVTVVSPPSAAITAPAFVTPSTGGNVASVADAGTGATYVWTITGGTITAGAGTRSITFLSGGSSEVTLQVVVTNATGCPSTCTKKIPVRYLQYWVPVAAHQPGVAGSQWRTDLGLLNRGSASATVHLRLHSTTLMGQTLTLGANAQAILVDVVDQFDHFVGAGTLEILADQPLIVTSRTYTRSASGTFGQSYDGFTPEQGLSTDGVAYLPQLTENASYRTNILIANTGRSNAQVRLELFDSAGTKVGEPTVNGGAPIESGKRVQLNTPFKTLGQTNLAAGYAKLTVLAGDGVIAYASVVDNNAASNDPTSVLMKGQVFGLASQWLPVVAHQAGSGGTNWRTDLGLLNLNSTNAQVTFHFHGKTTQTGNLEVPAGNQVILADVVARFTTENDAGTLEVWADTPLIVTSRTYNQTVTKGTFGQDYDAFHSEAGLVAGESAYIPQLVQNSSYRSNILVANTGSVDAAVKVELFAGNGAKLGEYLVNNGVLAPGQRSQKDQPFKTVAGRNDLLAAYARVTVQTGEGILASGSMVDNVSTDPTTLPMRR
jgi:sugar lactone lactonase YvrE